MVSITKIASLLLLPLPITLIFLFLGLFFLLVTARQKLGKIFVFLGFLILTVFSIEPVSYSIIKPLESEYPVVQSTVIPDYIIVLGNNDTPDTALPPTSQLNHTSRTRLVEALRLYFMYPDATLLLSGGHLQPDRPSNALIMSQAAQSLGVPKTKIQLFEYNQSTHDEAVSIAPVIRDKTAFLVTSANHMPRAMDIFRTVGAYPIPAPADFKAKQPYFSRPALSYFPHVDALAKSHLALHEWLGRVWALITGQIRTSS